MSSGRYEVLSQTVEELFSSSAALFRIPVFQRSFSWSRDEVAQLMDDVFSPTESSDLPYFLGSIVLARLRDNPGTGDLVLDGQQRLTTISLIIAVIIEKLRQRGAEDANEYLSYLFSRRLPGKRAPKVQLQHEDADLFPKLLIEPHICSENEFKDKRLAHAIETIAGLIDEYEKSNMSFCRADSPLNAMLDRLLYNVELVRITAPSEKDAFRLFETLNDRGLALSAADLIKNKLFSRCGSDIEDVIESWSNIVSLTKEDDIVSFLRACWIARHGFVRRNALYDSYRSHVESLSQKEAALFVLELEEAARAYENIITPTSQSDRWSDDINLRMARLNNYRAKSCRPALLASALFHRALIERVAFLCESITVRYTIIGEKNPNLLERLYDDISRLLRQPQFNFRHLANIDLMKEVPGDDEIIQRLNVMELESVTIPWRELLILINQHQGNGEMKPDSPLAVNIEHVLPQNPSAAALAEAKLTPEEAVVLSHKLGNLTLLSGKKNRALSNRPFSERRETYSRSDIFMTREIAKNESWGRQEIELRTVQMANEIAYIYPHPLKICVSL